MRYFLLSVFLTTFYGIPNAFSSPNNAALEKEVTRILDANNPVDTLGLGTQI